MENKKVFCIMPFMHLHNMSNGLLKICCLTERSIVDDFGNDYFIGNQSVSEVWNSNYMKKVREHMLDGTELELCKLCYKNEESGVRSLRQEYNEQYYEKNKDLVEEAKNNNNEIKSFPRFVELRTGNTCNSACRMCNSNDSHLIYKENKNILSSIHENSEISKDAKDNSSVIIGNPERIIFGNYNTELSAVQLDVEQHMDEVIDNLHNITNMTLSGGEPFLLPKTIYLLEKIADINPNIFLYINTNGTVVSDKILNILKRLNHVTLSASIDGVDGVQEYIRYPLKWNKVRDNLDKFYQIQTKKFRLTFNVTVQTLNILDLHYIVKYMKERYPESYLNLTLLHNPLHLNIEYLPTNVKKKAIKSNKKLLKYLNNVKVSEPIYEKNILDLKSKIESLIHLLENSKENEKYYRRFLHSIEIFDHYRKQNIRDLIPSWKEFL